MAEVVDVGKLRQVLDYWSCETCLDTYSPDQDYLCSICARLNREVVVKRAALGSDEAVQVIPPEDFTMAKDLRDRIQQQELELQEARAMASRLQTREQELESQLARLQQDLAKARKEKDESGLVSFEFVGVKTPPKKPTEPVLEFQEDTEEPTPQFEATEPTAPAQWETVETTPEAVAEEAEAPPQFEAEPAAETFEAPPPAAPRRAQAADDAIARIEAEIGKIEAELTELAQKEKTLTKKARTRTPVRRRPPAH